jgi:transcriptional regulator with GAF, ATPase, and Fis domain
MATVKRLAHSTVAVLIHGETGTGRGGRRARDPRRRPRRAAAALHQLRGDPRMLIESVLPRPRAGRSPARQVGARHLEQADGGSVLLTIGELAASAQAALPACSRPRGSPGSAARTIEVDVRDRGDPSRPRG